MDFPGVSVVKNLPANAGDEGSIPRLGREIIIMEWVALEKEMATHSIILAWKILWMEEPGELQSMGLESQIQPTTEQAQCLQDSSMLSQMTGFPPCMAE